MNDADRTLVEQWLGRQLRGEVRVVARCGCGPAVIETHPLADGIPFPTLYWLTCPKANRAIGGLESAGVMVDINERLRTDEDFAAAYRAANASYKAKRDELHVLEGAGGIGGGTSDRVKCLHAQYAHWLVDPSSPVGAWVAEQIGDVH